MSETVFPEFVENYLQLTADFLRQINIEFKLIEENPKAQARTYEAAVVDGPVQVVVHRTSDSIDETIGRYRVRVNAALPPDFVGVYDGLENAVHWFATFGALLPKSGVATQCLIPEILEETSAALLATAIAHARRSMLSSYGMALQTKNDKPIEKLSAWSDLDFECLNFDYAHLGSSKLSSRRWEFNFLKKGKFSIDAIHNNPYWGGGILCLLTVPKRAVLLNGESISAESLNIWGFLVGQAPTFGAWCEVDENFCFVQFLPNNLKEFPDILELVVSQAVIRKDEVAVFVEAERQTLAQKQT